MSGMKPCPFCGTDRFLKVDDCQFPPDAEGAPWEWGYVVFCDSSGLETDPRGCGAQSGWGETPDDAIAAWNRRASDSTIADLVKALEPFDAILDIFEQPAGCRPKSGDIMSWEDHRVGKRDLTVEMLRTARAALLKARGEQS